MPYKEGQLTFIDFLGYRPVMAMVKKRLFGGPYLTFIDYCGVLASVYESSAVVGRAKSDKLSIIEKIIEAQYPRYGSEPIKDLQKRAKEHLDEFKKERGREPHSFLEFILVKQLENALQHEGIIGRGTLNSLEIGDTSSGKKVVEKLIGDISSDKKAMKKVMKKLEMKISLKDSEIVERIFGREGIAFGISFPELTERMYRNLHENTEKPPIITLEEGEEEILKTVAVYTNRYWSEMLDPLDLRSYLEMVKEEDR